MALAVSGGIDSIVMLYEAAETDTATYAVVLNFGQPSYPIQRELVEHHVKVLQKRGVDVDLCPIGVAIPSGMLEGRPFQASEPASPLKSFASAFEKLDWTHEKSVDNFALIPARNSLIALYTAMVAVNGEEDPEVGIAFQFEPEQWDKMDSIGGDIGPRFMTAIRNLLDTAFDTPVRLYTPYVDRKWSKERILRRGSELNIDLDKTYSCEFYPRCGKCMQCLLVSRSRERVFDKQLTAG